jgi:hypothetical protein
MGFKMGMAFKFPVEATPAKDELIKRVRTCLSLLEECWLR